MINFMAVYRHDIRSFGKKQEVQRLTYTYKRSRLLNTFGGMVGLCVKCSPLTKVTPVRFSVRFPARPICELSCTLVLCCATRVFQTIQFSSLGKNQTLPLLAVLPGHNRLMWLAAQGALACLLIEPVQPRPFAIQLRVRMINLPNYYYISGYLITICQVFPRVKKSENRLR